MKKEDVADIIFKHTIDVVPELRGCRLQPGDALKDLGANSVDRSEIIAMTLETLSLDIPLTDTAGANNIGELAAILYEKLPSR